MHIVHINNIDLPGARFNGHDMQIALNQMGHQSYQFVLEKQGDSPNTICIAPTAEGRAFQEDCRKFEEQLSVHALVYPFARQIMQFEQFTISDIVHCHLIHNNMISLYDLEQMTKSKPCVWTMHDPWAVTGHCIHPMNCTGWKTGCKSCPHLDRDFPLKLDNSSLLWNIKKRIYADIDLDIVVASRWMERIIKESPLMQHFDKIHVIPFGINEEIFCHNNDSTTIKQKLGIPEESFVMLCRPQPSFFKGLNVITGMLDILEPSRPVVIVTVGYGGLPPEYKTKYNVIELGWVNDNRLMVDLYGACDVLLMPSVAESFGMMAIEAMASARPVIVMEGTALPDITFAPECGICIGRDDIVAMKEAVERLMRNPAEGRARGKKGRELVEQHYRFEDYVRRHLNLYKEILTR